LEKKANKRICSLSKLKNTPFLKDFSWDDFDDFKIIPPYIPKSEDYIENLDKYTKSYEIFNSKNVKDKINNIN
jgi:hypothetical protein